MVEATPNAVDEGSKTLSDALDYKGRPAVRSSTGGWISAAMILGVELCERLTTLGIAVNLVPYLTGTMHLGNAESANTVTNFMGASFMLCLLGGFIADTFLGRYLTIAIFTSIQASGMTILTISTAVSTLRPPSCPTTHTCPRATPSQLAVLYLGLYLTALGTGGLKSSASGFGSDQFDGRDKTERKKMGRFFNWYFFFISIGSLLAVTVLVYIQDYVGRAWGYGACVMAIVVALVVLLAGTTRYRFKRIVGSPLTQVATVVVAAWRKRRMELPADVSELYNGDEGKGRFQHSKDFRFFDKAAILETQHRIHHNKWQLSSLADIEEVKQVLRMLPIWATTIMFWTVYAQMTTFCVAQASVMDRRVSSSFSIPPASLTAFFVASILITVPTYDRIVVPALRRLFGNPNPLPPLHRIALGLLLSTFAMAIAALVELNRLHASKLQSVFRLAPQFFLIGAGEAFAYGGQLDFFLRECPNGMKTMSTGLFLSTLSLGFFFSSALVAVVDGVTGKGRKGAWLADDLNEGKLYDFYWLLAALSLLNLIVFMIVAKGYVYKETRVSSEDRGHGAGVGMDEEMVEEGYCHA